MERKSAMINNNLFVGIDVSKNKHDVAVLNCEKKNALKSFVIQDNFKGYNELLSKLHFLEEKYQPQTFLIGMEATGDYWKNLYHFLLNQKNGYHVTVINPFQTRAFAKGELRRAKTDPVDAKDIAQFMIEKSPTPTPKISPELDSIKDLDRQIYAINKQKTMTINRLRLELLKNAPEIEKAFRNLGGRQILALLAQFPTAQDINKASLTELGEVRFGIRNFRIPTRLVKKVKELCKNSIAYKTGPGSGWVVQSLVRRITQLLQEKELLQKQIADMYNDFKEQQSVLTSIKGISINTAIALEAYIGDVTRFPNVKKIVAYFGMNPTVCKSGKSLKRSSRLQKKGNGIVRQKLFQAVLCIISKKQGPFYKYYQRLVDSGKPKMVAIGATMRKLLGVAYAMLKKQQKFDPEKC
jgi:transposase